MIGCLHPLDSHSKSKYLYTDIACTSTYDSHINVGTVSQRCEYKRKSMRWKGTHTSRAAKTAAARMRKAANVNIEIYVGWRWQWLWGCCTDGLQPSSSARKRVHARQHALACNALAIYWYKCCGISVWARVAVATLHCWRANKWCAPGRLTVVNRNSWCDAGMSEHVQCRQLYVAPVPNKYFAYLCVFRLRAGIKAQQPGSKWIRWLCYARTKPLAQSINRIYGRSECSLFIFKCIAWIASHATRRHVELITCSPHHTFDWTNNALFISVCVLRRTWAHAFSECVMYIWLL